MHTARRSERQPPAHETFAAMDTGLNDGSARWILADSHRAEAGFQDPALGWISVRAQAGVAGIHAAVITTKAETAGKVLSGHLAGLNAHMSNHYEHMNTVTLSNPGTEWNGHDTGETRPGGGLGGGGCLFGGPGGCLGGWQRGVGGGGGGGCLGPGRFGAFVRANVH